MTPSERERRIEAAAKRRYESDDTGYQWEAASPDARVYYRKEATADLDAADEAVPMVSLAAVIDVLDRAYRRPGENLTHPADVIRASFSGEEGTET